MQSKQLISVLVMILVFAFIIPASGHDNPDSYRLPFNEHSDDHPWGGESYQPGEIPVSASSFNLIGTPFFVFELIRNSFSIDFINRPDNDRCWETHTNAVNRASRASERKTLNRRELIERLAR